jgi:hypothetical protein
VKSRKKLFKKLGISNNSSFIVFFETIITLGIIMLAWIFFRTDNIRSALTYISGMISPSLFSSPQLLPLKTMFLAFVFIFAEWLQRTKEHALQIESIKFRLVRWGIYFGCIFTILFLGGGYQRFIYFQF